MIALVVGGAKSGKSMFAQDLAKSLNESFKIYLEEDLEVDLHENPEIKNGKLYYVATMNPYDLEDLKRIENHLKEREGYGFNTIEETIEKLNQDIAEKEKEMNELIRDFKRLSRKEQMLLLNQLKEKRNLGNIKNSSSPQIVLDLILITS